MLAAIGILAALHARHQTGQGQQVETSLLEGMIYQIAYEATLYLVSGFVHGPIGSQHVLAVPYGAYPTADGHVAIAAMGVFENLCRAIERSDLVEDPRFATGRQRIVNRKELDAELDSTFSTRTTEEWLARLTAADVPSAPVNTIDKALNDPQVLDREMVVDVDHVLGGKVRLVGNPIKFAGTPRERRRHFESPPVIGQHTKEILAGLLSYGEDRIQELEQAGAITPPQDSAS
jgi:crotonobetainyl-CoA:carnitine CoA-transferase CaiB-like acyl-CoA transferase